MTLTIWVCPKNETHHVVWREQIKTVYVVGQQYPQEIVERLKAVCKDCGADAIINENPFGNLTPEKP